MFFLLFWGLFEWLFWLFCRLFEWFRFNWLVFKILGLGNWIVFEICFFLKLNFVVDVLVLKLFIVKVVLKVVIFFFDFGVGFMSCLCVWDKIVKEEVFINFFKVFKRFVEGVYLVSFCVLGVVIFWVCEFLIYLVRDFIDLVGFIFILLLIIGWEFFFFRFFLIFLFLVVFLNLVKVWDKFDDLLKDVNFFVFIVILLLLWVIFLVFVGICGWVFLDLIFVLGLFLRG